MKLTTVVLLASALSLLPLTTYAQDDSPQVDSAIATCANLSKQFMLQARAGGFTWNKSTWLGGPCPLPSHQPGIDPNVKSSWWIAMSGGDCIGAEDETPNWSIEYDRGRGIVDEVSRTRSADGKLTEVEIDTPYGGGMGWIVRYFHTLKECHEYQQKKAHQRDDLK